MPNRKSFDSKEEYNAWCREYRGLNRDKFRNYNREYMKKWREKNGCESAKKWQSKNKDKVKIQRKLRKAVKFGKIKKLPCEICGNKKSVGHHNDYSKPLKIRWLCHIHHRESHYNNRLAIDI